MLTTTYGESVTWTPTCESGPPTGPIENGTTYIVRPRMLPANTPSSSARIADGLAPVVRRAGVGLVARADERARLDARDVVGVGAGEVAARAQRRVEREERAGATICATSARRSSSEPSHQTTASGSVSSATASTHAWTSPSAAAAVTSGSVVARV